MDIFCLPDEFPQLKAVLYHFPGKSNLAVMELGGSVNINREIGLGGPHSGVQIHATKFSLFRTNQFAGVL